MIDTTIPIIGTIPCCVRIPKFQTENHQIISKYLTQATLSKQMLVSYPSSSVSPLMTRKFLRKDNVTNVGDCLIFTYPVTVSIRPKFASSSAAMSGEKAVAKSTLLW